MTKLPAAFLNAPITHRALHDITDGRPENSRAAIRAAIAAGYGIEIDLQISKDGQAMVFHDYDMNRLTEAEGEIRDYTAAELAQIPLRHGDEGVPSFAEVLELVAGQVPLLVEIKDQDRAMGPNVGALQAAVAKDLVGYEGPLALMSFNPHTIAEMAELAPDVPRGLVTYSFASEEAKALPEDYRTHLAEIRDFDRVGACFISHYFAELEDAPVARLKAQAVPILCWTIRSAEDEAKARTVADNVTFEGYLA
jgi:glycerophosphoryl diester phosphodiesterase